MTVRNNPILPSSVPNFKAFNLKSDYRNAHKVYYIWGHYAHISGLMQKRHNSIANPLELRLSCTNPSIFNNKYSLLMHRIKIKSPANFFLWNEWKRFCGCIFIFQSVLLWWYYNDKKVYRILAVLPFKMSATSLSCGLPWSLASTPWAMSLYFKFRAIYFWLLNEY